MEKDEITLKQAVVADMKLLETREAAIRLSTADDSMMGKINKFTLAPLKREQVAVFTLDVANDQVDDHFSRFPVAELRRITGMVVGRPLMRNHNIHDDLPIGTFFDAKLVKEKDVNRVRADVYMLRNQSNQDTIDSIVGGVYRATSLQWQFSTPECSICKNNMRDCIHWPGQEYDGDVCHYVIRDVGDVIEASIVPLGGQRTEFVAARTAEDQGKPILQHLCETRGVEIPPKFAIAEKDVDTDTPDADNVPVATENVAHEIRAEILETRALEANDGDE